jgi:hypothetical protein
VTTTPTPEQFNLATELVRVSEENTRLAAEAAKLTEERDGLLAVNTQLVKIGTGELRHMFRGQCPDEVEGFDVRDPGCPACGLLDAIPTATLAARDAEKKAEGREQFAIDAEHLSRQRTFSRDTFGPGDRLQGVLDHIRKELIEVEADPQDKSEWADVIILAFDGALRQGHNPQDLLDTVLAKQVKNEGRVWPDWRTQPTDRAIEHVRTPEQGEQG